jgi:hypothetical protein
LQFFLLPVVLTEVIEIGEHDGGLLELVEWKRRSRDAKGDSDSLCLRIPRDLARAQIGLKGGQGMPHVRRGTMHVRPRNDIIRELISIPIQWEIYQPLLSSPC